MKTATPRFQAPAAYAAALAMLLTAGIGIGAEPGGSAPGTAAPPPQAEPDKVVVTVNGETMTEKMVLEASREQLRRMTGGRPLPPQQMQTLLPQVRGQVIEQFITMALLKTEAATLKIVADKADVDAALARISTQLPPGVDLATALERQGMTEAGLREKIEADLTIRKLIDQQIPKDVAISDEEIAAFFAENAAQMGTPARARARHILFKVEQEGGDAGKAAKKAQAEALRQKLAAGGDFAALATEHSDCPSAQKGGDLGEVGRGQMVPAFEEAVFTQEVGQVGPIVETQFGYHIIEVTSREEAKPAVLADVRDQIEEQLVQQKRAAGFEEYVDGLRKKAKITPSDAAPAG